jgi:hypothetical protein
VKWQGLWDSFFNLPVWLVYVSRIVYLVVEAGILDWPHRYRELRRKGMRST